MFSERKSARDFLFSKRNLWCDITESIEGREATDVSVTIIEEKMNNRERWERGEKRVRRVNGAFREVEMSGLLK